LQNFPAGGRLQGRKVRKLRDIHKLGLLCRLAD